MAIPRKVKHHQDFAEFFIITNEVGIEVLTRLFNKIQYTILSQFHLIDYKQLLYQSQRKTILNHVGTFDQPQG